MSAGALTDRVVAVTGGGRGIGLAISAEIVRQGGSAVLLGRSAETLSRAAGELGELATPIACDVGDTASVTAAFTVIADRYGRLDALVNNAAVGWPHRIADVSDEELQAEVATNILGPIKTVRAAVPLLRHSDDPHVVNISSASVHDPYPYLVLYAAAKAALETLTAGIRHELAVDGIRVTLLRVGQTEGGGFRFGWDPERRAEAEQAWLDLGFKAWRSGGMVGQPAERVGEAVVFVLARPPGSVVSEMEVCAQPMRTDGPRLAGSSGAPPVMGGS